MTQTIGSWHNHKRLWLVIVTLTFLIVAASRIVQLHVLQMDGDDIWSIWQTFGSPLDIIHWTPSDWPPLYFLALGAWKELVGIQPIVLRFGSALIFLIGTACLYRFVRRLWGEHAALLTMLFYSAFGFNLYLSLFIRSYVVLISMTPLVLWMVARYFDRPTFRRAVWLVLPMTIMFYSHYTSIFLFALLGLYTLLVYTRQILRWWLPGLLLAILVVPQIVTHWASFSSRTIVYQTLQLPPLPEAITNLVGTFAGPAFWWFVILFAGASLLLILRRPLRPQLPTLLVWILMPVVVYLLQKRLGLFQSPKYLWWVLPGLALWLGWGLARLPQAAYRVIAVSLVVVMFLPNTLDSHQPTLQFDLTFQQLRRYLRAGDAVLIDPKCNCSDTESWDYFQLLYFPNGLNYVTSPAGYPRVWYISRSWEHDDRIEKAVADGRLPGVYFGPPTMFVRLYEGPPDPQGILFENGLRFYGATVEGVRSPDGVAFREGETVRVHLWWSIDKPVNLDYTMAIYLIVDGAVASQVDGAPQIPGEPKETSRWQTGKYYVEERDLRLPDDIYGSPYPIYLTVYQWWDNTRISAPGVNADKLLRIQTISIHAW